MLTQPEVVHDGDDPLEALGDLHTDVLVEAGAHGTERRQRGPVVLTSWRTGNIVDKLTLVQIC